MSATTTAMQDDPMTTLLALREARQAADTQEQLMRLVAASAREAERIAATDRLFKRVGGFLRRSPQANDATAPRTPVVTITRPQQTSSTTQQTRRPAA
jgi:hypothetical protein